MPDGLTLEQLRALPAPDAPAAPKKRGVSLDELRSMDVPRKQYEPGTVGPPAPGAPPAAPAEDPYAAEAAARGMTPEALRAHRQQQMAEAEAFNQEEIAAAGARSEAAYDAANPTIAAMAHSFEDADRAAGELGSGSVTRRLPTGEVVGDPGRALLNIGKVAALPFAPIGAVINTALGDPMREPNTGGAVERALRGVRAALRSPVDLPLEAAKMATHNPVVKPALEAVLGPEGPAGVESLLPFAAPLAMKGGMKAASVAEAVGEAGAARLPWAKPKVEIPKSIVRDAAGKPVVVYHGTGAEFEALDPAMKGENTGTASARRGFFFAESPDTAKAYVPRKPGVVGGEVVEQVGEGANLRRSHLTMENPLVHDMKGASSHDYRQRPDVRSFSDIIRDASRAGHDGVIIKNARDGGPKDTIYVTFEPGQEINLDAVAMKGGYPTKAIRPAIEALPLPDLAARLRKQRQAGQDLSIADAWAAATPEQRAGLSGPADLTDAVYGRGRWAATGAAQERPAAPPRAEDQSTRPRRPARGSLTIEQLRSIPEAPKTAKAPPPAPVQAPAPAPKTPFAPPAKKPPAPAPVEAPTATAGRAIPAKELEALGDEAWEGVEPAPSPAKPVEAPPTPAPKPAPAPEPVRPEPAPETKPPVAETTPPVVETKPPVVEPPAPVAEPAAPPAPKKYETLPLEDVNVDAKRFQHKEAHPVTGETGRLKHAEKFDQDLADPIEVWRDPVDGKTYVVNGHQRYGLARRKGAKEIDVRFIDAPDAKTARQKGAEKNLAAGTVEPVDAARFFRDQDLQGDALAAYMREKGITATSAGARGGKALANLTDEVWNRYLQGEVSEAKAIAIGQVEKLTPAQQSRLADAAVAAEEIPALARRVRDAGEATKDAPSMFPGMDAPVTKSLHELEARLETELLAKLRTEKGALRSAAKHSDTLERVGHVEKEQAASAAAEAGTLHGVAAKLLELRGPLRDAIGEAARAVDAGELTRADAGRQLRQQAHEIIAKEHPELKLSTVETKSVEPSTPTLFTKDPQGKVKTPFGKKDESGALRIPTKKEIVDAAETVRAGYEKIVGGAMDAVAKIADKVRGIRAIRQWGINDALKADPTEGLHQAQGRARGASTWGRREAELLARDIDRSLDDALGKGPSRDRFETYRYMGGERADLPAAARAAQATIDRAVAVVHSIRSELLARNLISKEVFDEYPRFLSRIMRAKGGKARSGGQVGKLAREVYRQDAHGVIVNQPQAEMQMVAEPHAPKAVIGDARQTLLKFETPEAREAFVKDVKAWDSATTGKGKRAGRGESLVVERFEPLTADAREFFQELVDPADSLAITVARARAKIATHDLLAELEPMGKGAPGGDWVMPSGPGPGLHGWKRLEGRQWGPLNGKWLRDDVHKFATEAANPKAIEAAKEFARGLYRQWKFERTAGNLPTTMRNLLSHHYMTVESGVNLANPVNARYWKRTAEILAGRDMATYKRFLKEGVIGSDFYAAEFADRVDQAMHGSSNPAVAVAKAIFSEGVTPEQTTAMRARGTRAGGELLINPLLAVPGVKGFQRGLSHVYRMQQESIRIAAALKLEAKGVHGKKLLRELDATTENYARGGGAQATAQNIPIIGPFARFTWERYRIAKNNLAAHPVRLAETLLYGYVVKKALEATFGRNVTPEEREAVEAEFGHQAAALDPDEKGRPTAYDPRNVLPFGNLLAGPETEKYDSDARAWMNYGARILGGGLAPGIEPIISATTGKDSRNRTLVGPVESELRGPGALPFEIWRQFVGPPVFGRWADQLKAARRGVPWSPKRPVQDPSDVLLSFMTGIGTGVLDYEVARQNLANWYRAKESGITQDLNEMDDRGELTDEAEDAADRLYERLDERDKQRSDTLDAAEKSRLKTPWSR